MLQSRSLERKARRCERGRGVLRVFTFCLALVGGLGPASAWQSHVAGEPAVGSLISPVAVFGTDDREPLPAKLKSIQERIGLLFNQRARTICTAFCVAKDIIATAGHCLHKTVGERPPRLADFWFARNYDAVRDYARIAGYGSGATAQHVLAGSTRLNVRPPIDAARDWALVRLARPICAKGVLPVRALAGDQILAAAAEGRIFQISYHRDFSPWKLAHSRPCTVARSFATADWATIQQDFSEPETLILHTCDTGGASSGSPLLIETPNGPEVIGINVGTYVQSKVLMQDGQVTRRLKPDTVANTGVGSTAFAAKLDAFREAAILGTPAQLRELQMLLQRRQFFSGTIDGTYGGTLRTAIEAYEKAEGLPVTGLATLALLRRLGSGSAPAERGKASRAKS